MRSGLTVMLTPRMYARATTPITCTTERTPAANALPVTNADAGAGVTISLASIPASRSHTIWMP